MSRKKVDQHWEERLAPLQRLVDSLRPRQYPGLVLRTQVIEGNGHSSAYAASVAQALGVLYNEKWLQSQGHHTCRLADTDGIDAGLAAGRGDTMAQSQDTPELYARNRHAWRKWLEKNHAAAKNVRLIIYHKGSKLPGIRYDEAVEEAICFGWIDGKANRRDEESFLVQFAKRRPASLWSKSNRQRAAELQKQGRMAKAGLETVELAKRQGTWAALAPAEDLVIPDDLRQALAEQPAALINFRAFRPSSKQMILGWIAIAKKPETRRKRIEETVRLAAMNISVDQYLQRVHPSPKTTA